LQRLEQGWILLARNPLRLGHVTIQLVGDLEDNIVPRISDGRGGLGHAAAVVHGSEAVHLTDALRGYFVVAALFHFRIDHRFKRGAARTLADKVAAVSEMLACGVLVGQVFLE
jgi:hypothetical protein